MSEELSLQVTQVPERKKKKLLVWVMVGLALIGLLAAIYFWILRSDITSQRAMADGLIYTVSPEVSAPLLEMLVEEGGQVHAGEIVARMDIQAFNRELNDAGKEVASLRPPEMDEISRRLKSSEEAENSAIQRIAKVRNQEETKQREMEAYVLEHVRAQLAMRSLAHLGPQHPDYRAAAEAELAARKRMERSKEEFEASSRVRAALSQELSRIHNEVLEAKRLASLSRYSRRPAPSRREPARLTGNADVVSPVDGTVIKVGARPGQRIEQGDPLLLILPAGKEKTVWVQAWFALSERKRLYAGLPCSVEKIADGRKYTGSVEAILAPSGVTELGERPSEEASQELFLPVRVRLDTPEGLTPGDAVRCQVRLGVL